MVMISGPVAGHMPETIPTTRLAWVVATPGQLPKQAIAALSVNGKSVYICNAKAYNGVHPGELTEKGCLITYNGKSILQDQYRVLVGTAAVAWRGREVMYPQSYWSQNTFYGVLPAGLHINNTQYAPVIGGYESQYPSYLHPLYICRVLVGDTAHVGKVVGAGCNVASGGSEVVERDFQVLSMPKEVTSTQPQPQLSVPPTSMTIQSQAQPQLDATPITAKPRPSFGSRLLPNSGSITDAVPDDEPNGTVNDDGGS